MTFAGNLSVKEVVTEQQQHGNNGKSLSKDMRNSIN